MSDRTLHSAALVGSRICHDLISPLGAINNGLELLMMSGVPNSPEMALIKESINAANARIRMFRIAYGSPSTEQVLGRSEVTSILRDVTHGTRITIHWEPVADLSRSEVQLAFLAIQCAEPSIPYGGEMRINHDGERWQLSLKGDRIGLDPALAALLGSGDTDQTPSVSPAQVQFMLLPIAARALGRTPSFSQQPDEALLTV